MLLGSYIGIDIAIPLHTLGNRRSTIVGVQTPIKISFHGHMLRCEAGHGLQDSG